jgi:hypothetical protein
MAWAWLAVAVIGIIFNGPDEFIYTAVIASTVWAAAHSLNRGRR